MQENDRSRAGRAPLWALAAALLAAGIQHAAADEEGLPKTPEAALALEQSDALPLTGFYETPANLAAGRPGDLLRHESFTGYQLPAGASAVRILYHSLSAEGRDVASSAAVLLPGGRRPAAGWPIIVWGHGTSGVARQCAPSAMKDVYYGHFGLFALLNAGFAIIAVDYHGLGTEGPHQYINKAAQTNDMIYSVPAAHAAVPSLGRKWVVDGHSQGGLAVWGVSEREATLKDPDYLGGVAVAAATHLSRLITHPEETHGAGFYMAWVAYAAKARYPSFQPESILSPIGMAHYRAVTTDGCWLFGHAIYQDVDITPAVKPGWGQNSTVRQFFADNEVHPAAQGGPIMVIAGEADQSVPLPGVRETVAAACRVGQKVTFRTYPGLDHTPTMDKSTPEQIAWIRERFAGAPAGNDCGRLPTLP